MKKNIVAFVMGLFCLLATHIAIGQTRLGSQPIPIEPLRVEVSRIKTTHIVFPYAILSVDIGSRDLLAQKAKGVENILQVKAAKEGFEQTNLTVVTADGTLTSFLVDYNPQPPTLSISIPKADKRPVIAIAEEGINEQEIQDKCQLALGVNRKLHGLKTTRAGITLQLTGIYVHDNTLYLRMSITNQSNINYDIDQLRYYIRDQKKVKRTASQEVEITPVMVYNAVQQVKGKSKNVFIAALPKFTIPDKKYMAIQLVEGNGGRHLEIALKDKHILKAAVLR